MIDCLEVFNGRHKAGIARFSLRRGDISTTFTYADEWLESQEAFALDPTLPLAAGTHHVRGLPGSFRDSLPDRWGRNLIKKQLLQEKAGARSLDDVDYLTGVSDLGRQGSLRFRTDASSPFLANDAAIPPLVELPRLLAAAREVTLGDAGKEAIKELLDAGSSSLGGARPKASVRDGDELLLAKFPHPADDWDVMGWEAVTIELAKMAGIEVPDFKLVTIGSGHVLLEKRFDRMGAERTPYLSAMSLCQAQDGDPRDYADVADAMMTFCRHAQPELEKLWMRCAFSCALHNTDDHLRNLGFLRIDDVWRLAPLFDVNPNPFLESNRATSILGARSHQEEKRALGEFGEYLGLSSALMHERMQSINNAVSQWHSVASLMRIPAHKQERFAQVLDRQMV